MKPGFPSVGLLLVAIALPAQAQMRMLIVAGPIRATDATVSGSFRVEAPRRAGIVSSGTGGACLVAERSDRACDTNQDCSDLAAHYHPDGAAYCLRPEGAGRHKVCWVRPGAGRDFCLKSPVAPLPVNTRIALPGIDPAVMGSAQAVRWRVHACLNGYDAATQSDSRACADPTGMDPRRLTSDGPSRRVP